MLAPSAEPFSVVVVGAWNIRVFSPEWVSRSLANNSDVELAVAVADPFQPLRLAFNGVNLLVGAGRIALSPAQFTDAGLAATQSAANRVLELLPHTPVSAAGINFRFIEDQPVGTLATLFTLPDSATLSEWGAQLQGTLIRRETTQNGRTVNITAQLHPDGKIGLEFNYHCKCNIAQEVLAFLQTDVVALRDETLEAITLVYGIERA